MKQGPCLPGPQGPEPRSIEGKLGCGCHGPGLGSMEGLKDCEESEFRGAGEVAYVKQGGLGLRVFMEKGSLDGGQGSLGEPGGDPRVLKGSPVSGTWFLSWEGNEVLLRVTEESDTVRAGLGAIWHL